MLNTIFERRSVRQYIDKPVETEKLQNVLKAAMYAPSAHNKQPWHFIVFDSKEKISDLRKLHPWGHPMDTAPIVIMVCGDTELEAEKGFYYTDCAASVENMLLAAKEQGLDTCWMGIFPNVEREKEFAKHLYLPSNIKPYALVSLGYSNAERSVPQRFHEDKIHYNEW